MPYMDGMQLARFIRADPALARTRLVMLTSTCAAGSAEGARAAGILRYVNKPIRQSELREVLVQALSIAPSSAPRRRLVPRRPETCAAGAAGGGQSGQSGAGPCHVEKGPG